MFGAITIVIGLYLVVWGKSKDQALSSKSNNIDQISTTDEQLPDKNLRTERSNDGKGDAVKANNNGDNAV